MHHASRGLGHFGRGHLGRGHYGRGHLGRGHLGRGHFGDGVHKNGQWWKVSNFSLFLEIYILEGHGIIFLSVEVSVRNMKELMTFFLYEKMSLFGFIAEYQILSSKREIINK